MGNFQLGSNGVVAEVISVFFTELLAQLSGSVNFSTAFCGTGEGCVPRIKNLLRCRESSMITGV